MVDNKNTNTEDILPLSTKEVYNSKVSDIIDSMNVLEAEDFSYKVYIDESKEETVGLIYFARGEKANRVAALLEELEEEDTDADVDR